MVGTEWSISNAEQRSRLYEKMEKDLEDHGATFLKQGETTQSLSLSDLFILKDGVVTPVLKVNITYKSTFIHILICCVKTEGG